MRQVIALCGGVLATFWLLVFMASLVVMNPIGAPQKAPTVFDNNVPLKYQEPVKKIRPTLPKRQEDTKPTPPTGIGPLPTETGTGLSLPPGTHMLPPDWHVNPGETKNWTPPATISEQQAGATAGATPVAQIPPQFPRELAQQGVEGWVKLRFMINEKGEPFNVMVIDAKPKNVFNQAAVNAIKKWRYRPAVNDGVAVISAAQEIVLDFKLENN